MAPTPNGTANPLDLQGPAMRTVRDDAGRHCVLLEASAGSSLVRDLATGERRYVDNDALEPVAGESPLVAAASDVDADGALGTLADERMLGLLVELRARGPLPVRALRSYGRCESDLHGLLAELQAAGLVVEETVAGERGYALSDEGADALADV